MDSLFSSNYQANQRCGKVKDLIIVALTSGKLSCNQSNTCYSKILPWQGTNVEEGPSGFSVIGVPGSSHF